MELEAQLLTAAEVGDVKTIKIVLDQGVDIEARSNELKTALTRAAESGRREAVDLLLSKGANIEAKDESGYTALIWASWFGHKELVTVLLAHGANVEVKNKMEHSTALIKAVAAGHMEVVDLLLSFGADIDAPGSRGETALMMASRIGMKEMVELLLNRGAKIESTDNDGNTPLSIAALFGRTRTTSKLIALGADVRSKNKDGKTALDIARAQMIYPAIVKILENALASDRKPKPKPKPKPKSRTNLVPVLPPEWSTSVDEKTNEMIYLNSETKEQLQIPPLAYPLLQDPSYGKAIAFYGEATENDVTSKGSSIDFGNGVEVIVPDGVVSPNTSITLKAQPAFASKDVFVLPSNIEAASPTYLVSSSSEKLNGPMTLTMEHFVKVRSEDDAGNLVFLSAKSDPSQDSTYHFKEVESGYPQFKPGDNVGKISTDQLGFWKVGKRSGGHAGFQNSNPGVEVPIPTPPPSLYTVRVYRSHENSKKSVVVVCMSYLHRLYVKFLDYLDKELIPSRYPEVSTKAIDEIIHEPLCFEGKELQLQASSNVGWSCEIDKPSITKRNVDLPEQLQVKPEELHSYPPKIVCRFIPNAKAPKEATCNLTLLGLDEPLTVFIPLFSPKRDIDTEKLKDAVFNLRVTAVGIKQTELVPIAKQIASEMDDVTALLSTSSSLDQLAQYTESTNAKVHELATKAKEVAKGCTAQHISFQLKSKLPKVEEISNKFNQIAKEQLLHCTGIAEEEKVLSDLVDTGTTLVSMTVEVVTSTERLSCIASLDIDRVDNTTRLDENDDTADILRELDGLESEYYTLGLHLHLPPGKVKEIQENNPHNCRSALGHVITEWLKMNYDYNKAGRPSWRMLVVGVSTLDIDRAKIIAKKHDQETYKGKADVDVDVSYKGKTDVERTTVTVNAQPETDSEKEHMIRPSMEIETSHRNKKRCCTLV